MHHGTQCIPMFIDGKPSEVMKEFSYLDKIRDNNSVTDGDIYTRVQKARNTF